MSYLDIKDYKQVEKLEKKLCRKEFFIRTIESPVFIIGIAMLYAAFILFAR